MRPSSSPQRYTVQVLFTLESARLGTDMQLVRSSDFNWTPCSFSTRTTRWRGGGFFGREDWLFYKTNDLFVIRVAIHKCFAFTKIICHGPATFTSVFPVDILNNTRSETFAFCEHGFRTRTASFAVVVYTVRRMYCMGVKWTVLTERFLIKSSNSVWFLYNVRSKYCGFRIIDTIHARTWNGNSLKVWHCMRIVLIGSAVAGSGYDVSSFL